MFRRCNIFFQKKRKEHFFPEKQNPEENVGERSKVLLSASCIKADNSVRATRKHIYSNKFEINRACTHIAKVARNNGVLKFSR